MKNYFDDENVTWVALLNGVVIDWQLHHLDLLLDRLPDIPDVFTITCLEKIYFPPKPEITRTKNLNLKFQNTFPNMQCEKYLKSKYENVQNYHGLYSILYDENEIWENIKAKLTPQEFVALKKSFEEGKL